MLLKTQQRRRLVISLTPLIDVVFILLVFFMLATSFLDWREYEIATVPTNSAIASGSKTASAGLLLKTNGQWLIDGEAVANESAIGKMLSKRLALDSELRVIIQAEASVPMQTAMDALDLVKTAGIKAVSLRPAVASTQAVTGGQQ